MGKTWLCLAIFAVAVGVIKTQSDNEGSFVDYEEYDDTWYNEELQQLGIKDYEEANAENVPVDQNKADADDPELTLSDQKVVGEIDKYLNKDVEQLRAAEELVEDYQIEDNRDKVEDDKQALNQTSEAKRLLKKTNNQLNDADHDFANDDDKNPPVEILQEKNKISNEKYADFKENYSDGEEKVSPIENKGELSNEDAIEETKPILDEIENKGELSIKDAIEQTKQILDKTESQFDDGEHTNVENLSEDSNNNQILFNKEVPEIVLPEDPNYVDDDTEDEENKKNISNEKVEEIVLPEDMVKINENSDELFHELKPQDDANDSVAQAYANLNEDLDKLAEVIDKLKDDDDTQNNIEDKVKDEEINRPSGEDTIKDDDYEQLDDDNISKLFEEFNSEEEEEETADDFEELSGEINSLNQNENIDEKINDEELKNEFEENQSSQINIANDIAVNKNQPDEPVADSEILNKVEYLSRAEVQAAVDGFDDKNKVEMQPMDCDGNIGPILKTLEVDESLQVTSCFYPNPYPTGKIIDWIFTGAGQGIELNITEFSVNGDLGDYLLIKPGQEDASGIEGLVVTHKLTSERKYRYLDVDRMFVRFVANEGPQSHPGFKFTVRMIAPLPNKTEELPEPVLPAPTETLTLYLGGLGLGEFHATKDDFRQLIADMAARYIEDNAIRPGLNTTSETTKIVSSSVCNLNWPDFETCVQVKFGVPLVYEDEETEPRLNQKDLETMWNDYKEEEEFAARLKDFGVSEYLVPNESSILMAWLIIGAGFVISAAMLAFALWRYSCIDHYTRMPAFSDTDSYTDEKRRLDLYPTPHQTLPPLYTDVDKWDKYDDVVRVDIGGVPNKSFARDDLYSLESDDDGVTSTRHDGFTTDV